MYKCKCGQCNSTEWEIVKDHGYLFRFICTNCGETYEIISLTDLEIRCEDV